MPDFSFLPTGCVLRPAKATDKLLLQRMLKKLEQELSPVSSGTAWVVWVVMVGIGAIALTQRLFLPEISSFFQLLAFGAIALILGSLAAFFFQVRGEWTLYWVIEYEGNLIACAKLQRQKQYSVLYDLYVAPEWRKQGLGSYLVNQLGLQATRPLYLACLPARLPFYTRLGFSPVSPKRLPLFLQYDLGLPTRPGIIPLVLM